MRWTRLRRAMAIALTAGALLIPARSALAHPDSCLLVVQVGPVHQHLVC